MSVQFSCIEIFTSEQVRYKNRSIAESVIQLVQKKRITGRCHVYKGTDAYYENGELVTQRLLALSFNMPVKIEIILPTKQVETFLPVLEEMVEEGIISVREISVYTYKTRRCILPCQLTVRDIMTPDPRSVTTSTPVDKVASILLKSTFTGMPVVDETGRPVGIITQGDLIYRADMPLRIGLMSLSDRKYVDEILKFMHNKYAYQVMTPEVVTVSSDSMVSEAVGLMIDRQVKRLPVVDPKGMLVGILSRFDVFRTITRTADVQQEIEAQKITVQNVRLVSDIMQRDTHTALPQTPIEEVLKIIDTDKIQRVAVVDPDNRFLGLISDRQLLVHFSQHKVGIWEYISRLIPFSEKGRKHRQLQKELQKTSASEVMETKLFTVTESTSIDDAARLMTEKGIKRLPVLDHDNSFKGMVSRKALLQAGFDRK